MKVAALNFFLLLLMGKFEGLWKFMEGKLTVFNERNVGLLERLSFGLDDFDNEH